MATPRRRWFPVYTTLYRDAIPREWKLAIVMLGCLMVDRWASERLTDQQATRTMLSLGDQLEVTGCSTAEEALALLRAIARAKAIRITLKALGSGFVSVHWPKLLETLKSRRPVTVPLAGASTVDGVSIGRESAPSSSSSSDLDLGEEKNRLEDSSDAAGPASVERALRILAQEPGSAEAKLAWMTRELPLLLAESERMEPSNPRARSAAFRGIAIRYWRQHNGRRLETRNANGPGTSPLAEAARAELRRMRLAGTDSAR